MRIKDKSNWKQQRRDNYRLIALFILSVDLPPIAYLTSVLLHYETPFRLIQQWDSTLALKIFSGDDYLLDFVVLLKGKRMTGRMEKGTNANKNKREECIKTQMVTEEESVILYVR